MSETSLGAQVIDQLNFARTQPQAYVQTLETYRGYFRGTLVKEPGAPLAATNEGVGAVNEAIAFMQRQMPLPPLAPNPFLTDAATRFVQQAGPAGVMGHTGTDGKGLSERLRADCFTAGYVGEIIAYRQAVAVAVAVAVVRQLIIDDGMRMRLHRSDIFSPVAKVAGVGCGPHVTQGTMCAIDLAGSVIAQPEPPMETDAELEARRTREDAATDKRFAASAPQRENYDARLDKIAAGSKAPRDCTKVKPSPSLDSNGVPENATIDFFCKDFDLSLYHITVDAAGNVTGESLTPAYRAYMTMEAAEGGGRIFGEFSYANGPDGRYVDHAVIEDANGVTRGVFTFNSDGIATTGQTFDAEGHPNGSIAGP